MLKKRIIPTLLWKNLGLVKGKNFNSWRRVGAVLPNLKIYNSRDVDELFLLDISATIENREPDEFSIKSFSSECIVPFCVGGGIKKISQIEYLLSSGADKVCINSEAYKNPNFIKEAVKVFGSQCIVISIDYKTVGDKKKCFSHSGKNTVDRNPIEWAMEMEQIGCGEILFTSIDLDGTMQGYDLNYIEKLKDKINIPIIAGGGAGKLEDFYNLLNIEKVSGSAAASIFHFTEITPKMVKNFLISKDIKMRDMFADSKNI
tara:strand:+ start:174 stop:953 length:780 start_codon:yes stop_codon:yes gene_type:complete